MVNTIWDVQEETSVGRKGNKRQYSIYKLWYHDSWNCSKKMSVIERMFSPCPSVSNIYIIGKSQI